MHKVPRSNPTNTFFLFFVLRHFLHFSTYLILMIIYISLFYLYFYFLVLILASLYY